MNQTGEKYGVVQVTKQRLNRHSFSEETQIKMKMLPPAVQIKSGLISDILSSQWSKTLLHIVSFCYSIKKSLIKKQSPDKQIQRI